MARTDAAAAQAAPPVRRVKLWDPALRAFHWLLVAAFATSWALAEFGPAIMTLHFWSGYAIAGLIVFRMIWGFVGPRPARFSSFLYGLRRTLDYARGVGTRRPSLWPGHNPLGGWAVVAMLALLAAQVATGLVSDPEDYINTGPLAQSVPPEIRRAATAWHETIFNLLLALIVLHVAAIAFYRWWKRENLVGPMVHGAKTVRADGVGGRLPPD
jgi:cytochrome b